MKITNTNKLMIVEWTYDIKRLCEKIDGIVLQNQGKFCFESGKFQEIDDLFDLARKLKELNK